MKRSLKFILPFILSLVLLTACLSNPSEDLNKQQVDSPSPAPIIEASPEPEVDIEPVPEPEPDPEPQPYVKEGRLVAVGDIMMHSPQIPAAYDVVTDTYSFDAYFTHVTPLLEGDWVIANLETPLAGKELGGYSGYPMFNAPETLADALRDAGFNIVSTANNHSLDRREQGLLNTLDVLKEKKLLAVGTHASAEEAEKIVVVEENEIRVAFLSYTYGTNGIPIPTGKDYLVNLLDEEKMIADIARAREVADVVTVSLHFGHEYHRQPSEQQKTLSATLIGAGADIILGSHPHVVQPYETVHTTSPEGEARQGIVIYSLGNFISNQGPDQGTAKYTDVGVIFSIIVEKQFPAGTISLTVDNAIPTWVHKYYANGKRQYRILPIETMISEKSDPLLQESHYTMLTGYYQEMNKHLQSLAVPVDSN